MEDSTTTLSKERFLSLDVFRGLTICLMIIVNSPGKGASLYPYLVHAKWLGFTLADLVFPSFMFAVGNAMSFSIQKNAFTSESDFLIKVFKRTILVFLIGYLMYWFPFFHADADGSWTFKPFSETRVMGVLQRIALAYCCAALLIHYFSTRSVLIVSGFLLLTYWAVLYLFGDAGQELTIGGNAIKKFDLLLLGEGHIYKKDAMPFDPEGILSTLPSVVNVIAGYLAGNFIRQKGKTYECLVKLMVVGIALVSLALWWGLVFPISKKLWTSSFTLYTIGIDILILSVLVYLIEIRKYKYGIYFFTVFGKNPLFIYLLSELAYVVLVMIKLPSGQSIFEWISIVIFQTITPGAFGSLLTGIWFMLMCWLAGWWLDKRKIYIKL
jgi:predicted acyltransferase